MMMMMIMMLKTSKMTHCGSYENDGVAGIDNSDDDNIDDDALSLTRYLEAVFGLPHLP